MRMPEGEKIQELKEIAGRQAAIIHMLESQINYDNQVYARLKHEIEQKDAKIAELGKLVEHGNQLFEKLKNEIHYYQNKRRP